MSVILVRLPWQALPPRHGQPQEHSFARDAAAEAPTQPLHRQGPSHGSLANVEICG